MCQVPSICVFIYVLLTHSENRRIDAYTCSIFTRTCHMYLLLLCRSIFFIYTCIFIYYIQRFIIFSAIVTIYTRGRGCLLFPLPMVPLLLSLQPAPTKRKHNHASRLRSGYCRHVYAKLRCASQKLREIGGGGGEEVAARDPGSCMHAVVMLAYNL